MNRKQIEKAFFDYLGAKDLSKEVLSLITLPAIFLNYYDLVRFEQLSRENDQDMLLFEYGIYDWGKGRNFEISLTRQFYEVFPQSESQRIFQQKIIFFFAPKKYEQVTSFNKWSCDCTNLTEFEAQIVNSSGFIAASKDIPLKQEISVELV